MIDSLIPHGTCRHCDEASADASPWLCGGCVRSMHRDPGEHAIGELRLRSAWRYEGALTTLLPWAKNPLVPELYRWLLEGQHELPEGAILVPIPTPWRRRFWRRGCQTTTIAEHLARAGSGRVVHGLRRRRMGIPQASLDAARRRALPYDTFVASRPVPGAQIVLVDDVCTTGSTMRAAAAALAPQLDDGATLSAFCVARVP